MPDEALVSWNVMYEKAGYNCQLTIRAGATQKDVVQLLQVVQQAIDAMNNAEDVNPRGAYQKPTGGAPSASGGKSDAPTCPNHHIPMKPSQYEEGSWYCSFKGRDGKYCDQIVKTI